jgi:XTP/dITP diphosphohydrolase
MATVLTSPRLPPQLPPPLRLVLASNNAKKLNELQSLLAGLALELVPQSQLGIAEAEEPHLTFIENALAKARHAAAAAGCAAIADDSGVCVDTLEGAPGVASAHFAGSLALVAGQDREALRRAQDAANNTLLLQRLAGQQNRRASFVCTLVAVRHAADPQPLVAVGRWPGEILTAARGTLGFGYDPLMFIPELGMTVAEIPAELKNQHSHRARAMAQLRQLLQQTWPL